MVVDIITNLLKAILNIKESGFFNLEELYPLRSTIVKNKINAVGDQLEFFVKDSFANSYFSEEREELYKNTFSYLGNNKNPPDLILQKGDAIEVKKIEDQPKKQLQLNSSFPEQKLHSYSSLISQKCRDCENGEEFEKDMLYVMGFVEEKNLKLLFFVYGDCFAKSTDFYQNKKDIIKELLKDSSLDMEVSPSKELSRFNSVDPLGVTSLRIRGMWLLKNPLVIFDDVVEFEKDEQICSVFAIMRKSKFDSFPLEDKNNILNDDEITCKDIEIRNPDNASEMIDAVLLRYDKK